MMNKPAGPIRGSARGRVPQDPQPLPPLPPADLSQRRRVGSSHRSIEQTIEDLARAFSKHAPKRARALLAKMDGDDWRSRLRVLAADLRVENISAEAFVSYVVSEIRKKGGVAYPERIFTIPRGDAESPWLASYRARGGGHIPVEGYRATPERRQAHVDRARARARG